MTFDIERLQKAINSGTITLPTGMTHQERREYVRRELEKLQDLRDEDYWYCWEEQEYTESGRYVDMLTDNQVRQLGEQE